MKPNKSIFTFLTPLVCLGAYLALLNIVNYVNEIFMASCTKWKEISSNFYKIIVILYVRSLSKLESIYIYNFFYKKESIYI